MNEEAQGAESVAIMTDYKLSMMETIRFYAGAWLLSQRQQEWARRLSLSLTEAWLRQRLSEQNVICDMWLRRSVLTPDFTFFWSDIDSTALLSLTNAKDLWMARHWWRELKGSMPLFHDLECQTHSMHQKWGHLDGYRAWRSEGRYSVKQAKMVSVTSGMPSETQAAYDILWEHQLLHSQIQKKFEEVILRGHMTPFGAVSLRKLIAEMLRLEAWRPGRPLEELEHPRAYWLASAFSTSDFWSGKSPYPLQKDLLPQAIFVVYREIMEQVCLKTSGLIAELLDSYAMFSSGLSSDEPMSLGYELWGRPALVWKRLNWEELSQFKRSRAISWLDQQQLRAYKAIGVQELDYLVSFLQASPGPGYDFLLPTLKLRLGKDYLQARVQGAPALVTYFCRENIQRCLPILGLERGALPWAQNRELHASQEALEDEWAFQFLKVMGA